MRREEDGTVVLAFVLVVRTAGQTISACAVRLWSWFGGQPVLGARPDAGRREEYRRFTLDRRRRGWMSVGHCISVFYMIGEE